MNYELKIMNWKSNVLFLLSIHNCLIDVVVFFSVLPRVSFIGQPWQQRRIIIRPYFGV